MNGVFTFGVIRVGVVGVLPRRSWDGIRAGSCVFVFVVGLYRVNDGLGVGCYLIGGRVVDGGEAKLVLGPGFSGQPRFLGCCGSVSGSFSIGRLPFFVLCP